MMHLALACKFVEPINELGVAASLIDDRLRVAKNWPNSPESRAKSWEDHSTAAQSRLVSALRDGAPQSGKETPSAPLDSKHKGMVSPIL